MRAGIAILAFAMGIRCAWAEGWELKSLAVGNASGETSVQLEFPNPIQHAPIVFGIPLERVATPSAVQLIDEAGNVVPADITALGNWQAQPSRWALISTVLDAPEAGNRRTLTIRWGAIEAKPTAPGNPITMDKQQDRCKVSNGLYTLQADSTGRVTILPLTSNDALVLSTGLYIKDAETAIAGSARVSMVHDGNLRKHIRLSGKLTDSVDIHREFDCYAGSPWIRCTVRFINRSLEDIPLNGIMPLRADIDAVTASTVGLDAGRSKTAGRYSLRQNAFEWSAAFDGLHEFAEGNQDNLGEWTLFDTESGVKWLVVFPQFQEMAAGDLDLASVIQFDGMTLMQRHYAPLEPTADVRLREGMARTFTFWIGVNPAGDPGTCARAIKTLPHAVYDRAHMIRSGWLPEQSLSTRYDDPTRRAARYFLEAKIPRAEFVRSSRGTEKGPDPSGEGMHEVNLHAGGMVYGEVFQYFQSQPSEADVKFYREELGMDPRHIVTGGRYSYRNGDIVHALALHAIRFGESDMWTLFRDHALLFADVSISHARESEGLGRYYCDWYVNPYVYQRFEGLLLGALLTGDTWWFETAKAMADYAVRSWNDGAPVDGHVDGGKGGVQSRSSYIAKMLVRMYDVTGERQYADTAINLAQWSIRTQENEGWWTMNPTNPESRAFRNSPIFSGYIIQGLWAVLERTGNPELRTTLLKCMDYHWDRMQQQPEAIRGALPNSYWYGEDIKAGDPVVPNWPATAQFADSFVRAYLVTEDRKYLDAAMAAWDAVLKAQSPEGGLPLSPGGVNSVWSLQIVEALPRFAAVRDATENEPN
ncbi:MAG: hypothetical protein AMXMBFR84_16180 [Candidatus Hydrogenedentota bacterium]